MNKYARTLLYSSSCCCHNHSFHKNISHTSIISFVAFLASNAPKVSYQIHPLTVQLVKKKTCHYHIPYSFFLHVPFVDNRQAQQQPINKPLYFINVVLFLQSLVIIKGIVGLIGFGMSQMLKFIFNIIGMDFTNLGENRHCCR